MTTFHTLESAENSAQTFDRIEKPALGLGEVASIVVKGLLPYSPPSLSRTNAPHGISPAEARRLSAAAYRIGRQGPALFLSQAGKRDNDAAQMRVEADKIKNHYCRFCRIHGAVPRWVEVWETNPGPHCHLICAAPPKKAHALRKSFRRSELFDDVNVQPVTDMTRLVNEYLGKEQTQQARFAFGKPIRSGSYKLPGGGDRVRMATALEAELIRDGQITPWRKTNARRGARLINTDAINRDFERARVGIFFADQLPELSAPPKARRAPQRREKPSPPTLQMDYPPTIVDMLAVLRERLTCEDIAERIGLSRQQTNNVAVERFDIGRKARERLVELVRAA